MCRRDRETPDSECDHCGHDPIAHAERRASIEIAAASVKDVAIDLALSATAAIGIAGIVIATVISLAWLTGLLPAALL